MCLNGDFRQARGGCVTEETEGQETGAKAIAGGVDPAAVALALGGASRERADAFLKKQEALIEDQRSYIATQQHHLREQFKQLRLNIWQQRMGVLLRIAAGFVGVAVAAVFVFMTWDASQSSGLLIEPFSVPPDLAQRGMTGEVVAARLLDNLSQIQAQAASLRPIRSFVNDNGQSGFKLEIPETGVSLTELDDFLREKLGHDTHITGEIVRTASGLSLTARAGGDAAQSVSGSDADLDRLVQQLSENVYRLTEPFRYGLYVAEHDRLPETISIMKDLAQSSSTPPDRAYGFAIWGAFSAEEGGVDTALRILQQAMDVEPKNSLALLWLAWFEPYKGLHEQAVRDGQKAETLLASDRLGLYPANTRPILRQAFQGVFDSELGNFHDAVPELALSARSGFTNSVLSSAIQALAEADEHDLVAARRTLFDTANFQVDPFAGLTAHKSLQAKMQIDSEAEDWANVLSDADAITSIVQKYPGVRSFLPETTTPLLAYAEAKLGKIADAEAHIAAAPADCYDCLITRARTAELEGQHTLADQWFARAIDGQKSIPFAYAYWGQALLERGDLDGAIAKFTLANQKGPKFADPLEMWGEALIKKNRSDLALGKFAEAEKYAPNWGRLHLKWGEALSYAGKKDEAQKQFAQAAGLDISAADKQELARVIRS
jgi:tetratricopeptide (TPR) repeat protein